MSSISVGLHIQVKEHVCCVKYLHFIVGVEGVMDDRVSIGRDIPLVLIGGHRIDPVLRLELFLLQTDSRGQDLVECFIELIEILRFFRTELKKDASCVVLVLREARESFKG